MASDLEMPDSPTSSLSSLASDDLIDDLKPEERDIGADVLPEPGSDEPAPPPSKRRRTNRSLGPRNSSSPQPPVYDTKADSKADISSDSSGDIPGSPTPTCQGPQEDEAMNEQVSVCRWIGCPAGNLGTMDSLVEHIHNEHIVPRQKKYFCEWDDCHRTGCPHASGYALKSHMRSHTREKPFYCLLPECDRCFTRSDALAKHLRTVHETEALRPSDPVPKSHANPPAKLPRLKLILSARPPDDPNRTDEESLADGDEGARTPHARDTNGVTHHGISRHKPYPSHLQFTKEEMALPPKKLYQLLTKQLKWAEEEAEELRAEVEVLERKRKEEWKAKELLLENVQEAELIYHTRRLGERANGPKMTALPKRLPISTVNGEVYFQSEEIDQSLSSLDPETALGSS
ncbi:MAG: hypothetical protein M1816_002262 [Peltula sp. TS41687]|nr:MAG: hypothetical protein M1816_002262 [Peltula sp. TS41687]